MLPFECIIFLFKVVIESAITCYNGHSKPKITSSMIFYNLNNVDRLNGYKFNSLVSNFDIILFSILCLSCLIFFPYIADRVNCQGSYSFNVYIR